MQVQWLLIAVVCGYLSAGKFSLSVQYASAVCKWLLISIVLWALSSMQVPHASPACKISILISIVSGYLSQLSFSMQVQYASPVCKFSMLFQYALSVCKSASSGALSVCRCWSFSMLSQYALISLLVQYPLSVCKFSSVCIGLQHHDLNCL